MFQYRTVNVSEYARNSVCSTLTVSLAALLPSQPYLPRVPQPPMPVADDFLRLALARERDIEEFGATIDEMID